MIFVSLILLKICKKKELDVKKLEYLDLIIPAYPHCRDKNYKTVCNFKKGFHHLFHTDNMQLNTIVDLIINFSEGVKIDIRKFLENINNNEELIEHRENIRKILENFNKNNQNLDYLRKGISKIESEVVELRKQNISVLDLIRDLNPKIRKFPSKTDIRNLLATALETPKEIEKITLEKIDHQYRIFKEEADKIRTNIQRVTDILLS